MPPPSSPDRDRIVRELRTFVAQWFRDGREDGLLDDTPLVTSGIVDSAGVLEVVDFVERQFGVAIADTDLSLQNCNTLQSWAALVESRSPAS
ncbi:MAG: acyl carrier protein [Planctomycetota bacterium]